MSSRLYLAARGVDNDTLRKLCIDNPALITHGIFANSLVSDTGPRIKNQYPAVKSSTERGS